MEFHEVSPVHAGFRPSPLAGIAAVPGARARRARTSPPVGRGFNGRYEEGIRIKLCVFATAASDPPESAIEKEADLVGAAGLEPATLSLEGLRVVRPYQ